MTTTTVADLLGRGQRLTADLHTSQHPVTVLAWQQFDASLHRLLGQLTYPGLPPLDAADEQVQRRVDRVWDDYPLPMSAMSATIGYTRAQFATAYDTTEKEVQRRIDAGLLPTHRVYGQLRIGTRTDLAVPELAPPDAASPLAFDRVTVTLGTLGDLLEVTKNDGQRAWSEASASQRSAAVSHLLAIAVVAGRHAASWMGPEGAQRPLLIARYAEHHLDGLHAPPATGPLFEAASFHAPAQPATPNEALQAALHAWLRVAHTEVERQPPSAAVLRDIASQTAHLYALAGQLTTATGGTSRPPSRVAGDIAGTLEAAAHDLIAVANHWKPFTTLQRPGLSYASATENLSATLVEVTRHLSMTQNGGYLANQLHCEQGLHDVRRVTDDVNSLLHDMAQWPARLAFSRALIAPARQLPSRSRRAKTVGPRDYVPARLRDIRHLMHAAEQAEKSVTEAHAALDLATGTVTDRTAIQAISATHPGTSWERHASVLGPSAEPAPFEVNHPQL